jgi:hypothetical protein
MAPNSVDYSPSVSQGSCTRWLASISQLIKVRVEVMLWPTVSRVVSLGIKPPSGAQDQILLLSDSCGFVDVGRPLWRQDAPVVHNCCRSSPAQSFSGPSPAGLMTILYCLRFETQPTWRARPLYLYPPGTGWHSYIPPGTGFPFRLLLRLAGLRWKNSNPPPSRDTTNSHSQSYFTTGGLPLISSSWRQATWDPRPEILFFNRTLEAIILM